MKTNHVSGNAASTTSTASQLAPSPDAAADTASQSSAAFLTKVQECTALLDQVLGVFPSNVDLTPVARMRSHKLRKGGGKVIPVLAQAAREMNVHIPIAPVDPMLQNLAEAESLVPLQAKVAMLEKRISDHVMVTEGAAWATGTALYSILRRLAKGNGKLTALLAPAQEFFGYRHASVRKEHPKTKKGKDALKLKTQQEGTAPTPAITEAPNGASNGVTSGSSGVGPTNGAVSVNGVTPTNGAAAH